jgi:tetratricopeptide (TPR) repeat protein
MSVHQTAASLACLVVVAAASAGAQQIFLPAACDIKPGHDLVNSGMQSLRNAFTTKFADQRTKDLKDADRVLTQAVSSGKQDKNPAAWYYLGRYYVMENDLPGADSAFAKALALAPKCDNDIRMYRRNAWVPVVNAGVQAYQVGNADSAIAAFRRANQIYTAEPVAFIYLANLFVQKKQPDSAVVFFRRAAAAATDSSYAQDKRDALFNVARVYHSVGRLAEAAVAYREYLVAYPRDLQATASLAGLYLQMGKRDSAMTLYGTILEHADSAAARDLFAAAEAVVSAVPEPPDTATMASKCRSAQQKKTPPPTPRQIITRCARPAADSMASFHAVADPQYRLAAKAYEAGLAKNPYFHQALYNLGGISYLTGDTSKVVPLAQRLYALDPLNRNTLADVVRAWQLLGKRDSVQRYLNVADSMPVEVTVSDFTATSKGATVQGLLTNFHAKPSAPFTITWQFLDAHGNAVATQPQSIAVLDTGANQAFTLKAEGSGIVAWRYKR